MADGDVEQEQLSLDAENLTRRTHKHLDGYRMPQLRIGAEKKLYTLYEIPSVGCEADLNIPKRSYQIRDGS